MIINSVADEAQTDDPNIRVHPRHPQIKCQKQFHKWLCSAPQKIYGLALKVAPQTHTKLANPIKSLRRRNRLKSGRTCTAPGGPARLVSRKNCLFATFWSERAREGAAPRFHTKTVRATRDHSFIHIIFEEHVCCRLRVSLSLSLQLSPGGCCQNWVHLIRGGGAFITGCAPPNNIHTHAATALRCRWRCTRIKLWCAPEGAASPQPPQHLTKDDVFMNFPTKNRADVFLRPRVSYAFSRYAAIILAMNIKARVASQA